MQRLFIALIVLSILLAGCNRGTDDDTTTTTTTVDNPVTRTTSPSTVAGEESTPPEDTETSVTTVPPEPPEYSIVRREGAEGGDRLVVLLEDYEYTDLVLEDLIFEITEDYAPVLEAYLIDDTSAADLVLLDPETLTDADRQVLEEHLFVALTEGTLVTFRGPFADMGEFRLGS